MGDSGSEGTSFRFSLPWGQTVPVPMVDNEDASLSGVPTLSSARMDFPAVMTLAAEQVGLPLPPPLPPRPVNRLRSGVYGPVHPAQPTFVLPQLPEVWRCVEATWQQPLKTKAPVAAMAGIIKVVDRSDTTCPGVPPLDENLAAHLLPRAAGWAEGAEVVLQPAFGPQEAQTTAGDHPPSVEGNLRFRGSPDHLRRGSSLGRVTSYITVFTDASRTGWGGTCLKRAIGGRWALTEFRDSDLLELRAVVLVLRDFMPLIQGRHVMVRSNNSTTVAYINKQGGVRSASLLTTAEELWLLASEVVLSREPSMSRDWRTEGPTLCRVAAPCQASGCFTRRW